MTETIQKTDYRVENIYRHQFVSVCPANHQPIVYSLLLASAPLELSDMKLFKLIFNPVNLLIFSFIWVGVALIAAHAPFEVALVILNLMGLPAFLGYQIGRGRK